MNFFSDHLCGFVGSLVTLYYKSKTAVNAILDFFINANNFALDGYMSTKLGGIIKGGNPKQCICKPEVEDQYGGCSFSETGISIISAGD